MKKPIVLILLVSIFSLAACDSNGGSSKDSAMQALLVICSNNDPSDSTIMTTKTTGKTYTIVDTGQTTFYNNSSAILCSTLTSADQAFYGQDAQYSGNQPNYTLSSDGRTVDDNSTGLTWMRGPNMTLASPVASDKKTYGAALTYVATVNAAAYGGYNDWRLPSVKELYSLIIFKGTDPSGFMGSTTGLTPFIDTGYFNFAYGQTSAGERIIDSQYLSSTVYVDNPSDTGMTRYFGVNFADGRIKGYDEKTFGGSDKTFFVQLVRGNTSYGVNSFTDNGDDTVSDAATGLMWMQHDSASGMTWEDALAWAKARNRENYLGHNDWRLPNAKELQSIVDYTHAPDYDGRAAINDIFTCTSIMNENNKADYPWYWTGTTHAGSDGSAYSADYICFGRALGYMNGAWYDIHGAGCQRSDPKSGSLSGYAFNTNGYYNPIAPQGDAIRIYNYVRLVRNID